MVKKDPNLFIVVVQELAQRVSHLRNLVEICQNLNLLVIIVAKFSNALKKVQICR